MEAYLDHAATSPLRPEARAAMEPWLDPARTTNPNGVHRNARTARGALEEARDAIAETVRVDPHAVVFTSGGTEALNAAVYAVLSAAAPGVVVRSAIEHDAVRASIDQWAAHFGHSVRSLPVTADGVTTWSETWSETWSDVRSDARLVAVMAANNEIGTLQPDVRGLTDGAPVLCDAVCAAAWVDPATIGSLGDLVALSGHKIGGPAGIGVLIAPGGRRPALLRGGAQEQDRRSGTQNVPGAVGLAAAVRALADDFAAGVPARVAAMRDRLADGLLTRIDGSAETGARALKVAGNVHLCIEGVVSEELLVLLDRAGVAASAGSACSSGAMHASHVLLAIGISRSRALGSLRLTLGRTTTDAEIDHALSVVPAAVVQLRR